MFLFIILTPDREKHILPFRRCLIYCKNIHMKFCFNNLQIQNNFHTFSDIKTSFIVSVILNSQIKKRDPDLVRIKSI